MTLQEHDQSPINLHSLPSHSKEPYAKRKMEALQASFSEKMSKVMKVDLAPPVETEKLPKDVQEKIDDMDELIRLMKEKLQTCNTRREKIQVLTLAPNSWSRKKVAEEFNASDYAVRQARILLKEKGLMALPEPRKGKKLSDTTVELVRKFYEDDEYSRLMPGKKDTVSVCRNEHVQKRLLLCNLNELYTAFKMHHSKEKIGFSTFCSLRPKWCVLVGSAGSHSVCVCTYHENVKLLLQAISSDYSYKELIKLLVCSTDNRDCMLRHCQKCPGNESFKSSIQNQFEQWDPEDEVTYSEWVSTNRTEQIQRTVTLEEYLNILEKSLEKLMPHSFIAKAQSRFLKEKKENLDETEAIVILDFSQNFEFVIQDEVQGYHWTKDRCYLHPVVIYTKKPSTADELGQSSETEDDLTISSICILSEDLEHDVGFIYESQKIITDYIKANFPQVKSVLYFSDGCAGQYKNFKKISNLCHHNSDFHLIATWAFFATSHGKSPSDGIGGTVKRLVTRESLQRDRGNPINNVDRMYDFCITNFQKIVFYNLKKEKICETRQELEERFSTAKTVPGTRSFHHFIPVSENTIATKRISEDEKHSLVFCFNSEQQPKSMSMSQILMSSYIACVYNNQWFFGLVLSKNEEENDVEISFLRLHGPSPSFYWPVRRKTCCIPINHILCTVTAPSTTSYGRVYRFVHSDVAVVQQKFSAFIDS